jgi:putative hydroxymethylpyrimidine transport system substrate-binding protein
MRKPVFTAIALTAFISGQAMANEKLTLVLDWYINPDHAPIMVAEQIGAFKAQGWTLR